MKRFLAAMLCLALCLGACVCAFAKTQDKVKDELETVNLKELYEIGKETVTIRVPEKWKTYIDKPSVLETLADGEVSDGILAVSYLPVEGAVKKGTEKVKLYAYDEASAQFLLLNLKIGKNRRVELDSAVISKFGGEASVILEDGGKKLTVRLLGNPTTGYQWTYIPDDSGVMELVKDGYSENGHPQGYVGVGGAYTYEFKAAKGRPGNKTTLRFEYGRSWLESFAWAQLYDITVDKNGVVQSIAFRNEEGAEYKEEAKLEKSAAGKESAKSALKSAAAAKADNADKAKGSKKPALKAVAGGKKAAGKTLIPNILDMMELSSDEVFVIRVPEKWEFYITNPQLLETLAEGERANGVLSVSFVPNKAGLGKKDETAFVTAYGDDGSLMVALKITPKGKISLDSATYQLNVGEDSYAELTVDGAKKQLEVSIAGNKKTGDVWTAVPDNSGVLKIEEKQPETIDVGDAVDVGTLYSWIIKGENKRPGDKGSVIFSSSKGPAFKLNIGLDKRSVIQKIDGEAA